jgi:hypothetical protein
MLQQDLTPLPTGKVVTASKYSSESDLVAAYTDNIWNESVP